MTFSYSTSWTASGTLSAVGMKCRFLTGDTVSTDALLSDEEITALIAAYTSGTAANYLAATCADAIAASFARKADITNMSSTVSASQRFAQYSALAARLRAMPPGQVLGGDGSSFVLAGISVGGRTQSQLDDAEADTSLVGPAFKRGMHDNPGATLDDEDD